MSFYLTLCLTGTHYRCYLGKMNVLFVLTFFTRQALNPYREEGMRKVTAET